MGEGSWVGLDVHARSTVAGVLDGRSGELRVLRVPPQSGRTVEWLRGLPRPVRVAYEAGPTGYGLAPPVPRWGSLARWRRLRRSRVRRVIGSRLTGATRSGLPGCCVWASWWRCAFRSRTWMPRVISCAHARTRAAT
jgi:hypothetical protein